MIYQLPNILSVLRIILAPIFFILLISENKSYIIASCLIYLVAALTDYFDGWLARRLKAVSVWGNFIDPLADKILTSSALIAFVMMKIIPLWMVLIIVVRDFGTTFLRVYTDSQNIPMKTSKSAKFKTFLQMLFIALILLVIFLFNLNIGISEDLYKKLLFNNIVHYIMMVLVAYTVWTLFEYITQNNIIKIWK